MTDFGPNGVKPGSRYEPSGWFNPITMIPLLAAAIGIATGMGYLLVFTEDFLYVACVTALVLEVPVLLAIWAVIWFGKCRNAILGPLIGLVLGLIYYVGYWEFSYRANIIARGPAAVAGVEKIGGAPGLPGYIVYRCKTSLLQRQARVVRGGRAPKLDEQVFCVFFFSLELIAVLFLAVELGRVKAGRVYYEEADQWGSKIERRLPVAELATILNAIETHDWPTIAALPCVPSSGDRKNQYLSFQLEYLPGSANDAVYVTLCAINVWRKIINCPGGVSIPKPRWGRFYKQVVLDKSDVAVLARLFRVLPVGRT